MYNLIEYSNNYIKTLESLWQCYGDEPTLNNNGAITHFPAPNNNGVSFKFRRKIAGRTESNGANIVEIIVPLKYLRNFWRTLEMPLTNCKINLIVTWSTNYFIIDDPVDNQIPTFTFTTTEIRFSKNK